jgi:hypothetical protein
MAKAASGAKSLAIHDYLSKNPGANAQTIVEDLKQKGVEVSLGLAKAVKYGKKGKTVLGKRAGKGRTMKGKAITGSESIRRYIAKHPSSKPKEIELGLKQEGVNVSRALISNVKYGGGKKAGKKKRRMKAAVVHAAARKTSAALSVEQLLAVKQFADSIGGVEQVRTALDTLEQLR